MREEDRERLRRLFYKRRQGWGSGCWLWPTHELDRFGYGCLTYKRNKKMAHIPAHRLSYLLHKGPIPDGLQIRHDCDNPCCVNPNHLRVGTQQDNENDKRERNRVPRGQQRVNARLSDDDVRSIRELHAEGLTFTEIALLREVSTSLVSRIIKGKGWRHLVEQEDEGDR